MRKIKVDTEKEYEVLIGEGLIDRSGVLVRSVNSGRKAAIISDENVASIHARKLREALERESYQVTELLVPAGERSKCFSTLETLVEKLAEAELSRDDVVLALGGGMVGDLAGFAASIYMRGVSYVQIPTSLLAAVDSSVGGKTAINLTKGKNLAGTFYQPDLVICDTDCLASLPEREFISGFGEIIKYAMIADPEILDMLDSRENMEALISRCIEIKAEIVANDERESGTRKLLNFGHSFGHAIEKSSDYELLHGEAVSLGMSLACELSARLGKLEPGTREKLSAALQKCGLGSNFKIAESAVVELTELLLLDKKARGRAIDFILPIRVGECEIVRLSIDEIIGAFDEN